MEIYRSSPIPTLLNLAGIPPLKVRRLQTLKFEVNLAVTSLSLNFIAKLQNLLSALLEPYKLNTSDIFPLVT